MGWTFDGWMTGLEEMITAAKEEGGYPDSDDEDDEDDDRESSSMKRRQKDSLVSVVNQSASQSMSHSYNSGVPTNVPTVSNRKVRSRMAVMTR